MGDGYWMMRGRLEWMRWASGQTQFMSLRPARDFLKLDRSGPCTHYELHLTAGKQEICVTERCDVNANREDDPSPAMVSSDKSRTATDEVKLDRLSSLDRPPVACRFHGWEVVVEQWWLGCHPRMGLT
jgi:hypothetical protein